MVMFTLGAKAKRVGGRARIGTTASSLALLAVGCCLLWPSMALPTTRPLQVITSEGRVDGVEDNGVHIFKSVPFAAPPIESLRFAPPLAPLKYLNGVYDASNLANTKSCMQFEAEPTSDEDCLYLDIYTPSNASATLLPVYVFIHGGAFVAGSKEPYSGISSFARKANIIAVAINYRLGAFGWMRVNGETPGNYGFLDQLQALKWINSNIANFGGNPNLVTIGGQSAGANSVLLHLISPLSTGLFHRAFIESAMPQSYYPTKEDANATSLQFSGYFNCVGDDLKTCLQSVDSVDIINKQSFDHIGPCLEGANPYYGYNIDKAYWYCGLAPEVGNTALPGQVLNQLDPGVNPAVKSVPILVGTAWNEGLTDSSATYNPIRKMAPDAYENNQIGKTQGTYLHFLNQITDLKSYDDNATSYSKLFSQRAQSVYQMYPYDSSDSGFSNMYPQGYNGYGPNTPLDANYVYNALYHDKWYLCPTMTAMSRVSKGSKARKKNPVYMYRFAQQTVLNGYLYEKYYNSDPVVAVKNDFYSKNLYPSHGDDESFFNYKEDELYSDDEKSLGLRMFSALADFIYTGDPNIGPFNKTIGATTWKKYYPPDRNMILLTEPQLPGLPPQLKGVRARQCAFWEKQGFVFPVPI